MANTIVRTNVMSLNSHRNLGLVANQQSRSSQRLSSGFRINSAADDAAGLGISEKMRAQIRGLDQASRNGADGISLIQTAEGALDTVNEILIRVRELVVQAANDTNVGGTGAQSDRLRIQDEIDQLMEEIDAIATRTEFNTRTLLDGQLSSQGAIRGGEWTTVDQVRTNAPSRIQSLDQLLRTTSNTAFEGSFEALLTRIGADMQDMSAGDWLSIHANNLGGLEAALDNAMGVTAANPGGRWDQLPTARGLNFTSARDLLDSFAQGLHNPNALRAPGTVPPGSPQMAFADWDDFLEHADPDMGASTFARAESTAGGVAIYQALRSSGFQGLTNNSTFSEVRNVLYQITSNSPGWGSDGLDGLADALGGWLSTRMGDVQTNDTALINARNAAQNLVNAQRSIYMFDAEQALISAQNGVDAASAARNAAANDLIAAQDARAAAQADLNAANAAFNAASAAMAQASADHALASTNAAAASAAAAAATAAAALITGAIGNITAAAASVAAALVSLDAAIALLLLLE